MVKIDNKKGTEIYLSSLTENTKGKDKDGDEYIKLVWMCRDENGTVCELTSIDYPSLPDRIFQIRYNDCVCVWYTIILKRGTEVVPETTQQTGNSI